MKFKKLESGRSMVEMLGVLAIIGVLSVGGIAGYSLSMRRHRANGVVDLASKYALVVYGNCQQRIMNGDVENSDDTGCLSNEIAFESTDIGAIPAGVKTFAYGEIEEDDQFVDINVLFTDQKLCQAVASITGGSDCFVLNGNYVTSFKIKQN